MQIIKAIKDSIDENTRRITTDRNLQTFMLGAFLLLIAILVYCTYYGSLDGSEECFRLADRMLSGNFDYNELGREYLPLTMLLLIPPRLFSPTPEVYSYLFSLYGFAFYMLGGHFLLKSCRRTGYSEKDAYALLFLIFLCSLSFMLLNTGVIAASLVILSLWFFHGKNYTLSFTLLALATMSGLYPAMLFITYLIFIIKEKGVHKAVFGIMAYLVICLFLICVPYNGLTEDPFFFLDSGHEGSYMSALYDALDLGLSGKDSLALGILVSATVLVLTVLTVHPGKHTMRNPALVFAAAVIPVFLICDVYTDMYYVWIAMLFPMTQMTKGSFEERKTGYLVFIVFSVSTLLCDHTLTGSAWDITSVVRTASLLAVWVFVLSDIRKMNCKAGPEAGKRFVRRISRRYPARAWHPLLSRNLLCWPRPSGRSFRRE